MSRGKKNRLYAYHFSVNSDGEKEYVPMGTREKRMRDTGSWNDNLSFYENWEKFQKTFEHSKQFVKEKKQ